MLILDTDLEALGVEIFKEHVRAMEQRDKFLKTGVSTASSGGEYDACFTHILRTHMVMERTSPPKDTNALLEHHLKTACNALNAAGDHYTTQLQAGFDALDSIRIMFDGITGLRDVWAQRAVEWRDKAEKSIVIDSGLIEGFAATLFESGHECHHYGMQYADLPEQMKDAWRIRSQSLLYALSFSSHAADMKIEPADDGHDGSTPD